MHVHGATERLHGALTDENDRGDKRDRQQHVDRAAHQVDPEVADGLGALAGEPADESDGHCHSNRRGQEVLHRKCTHLRQVGHGDFARIGLPVRIRDERHRRVPRSVRAHAGKVRRIEGQMALQPEDRIRQKQGDTGEYNHRRRIARPSLLCLWVNPQHPVNRPFQPFQPLRATLIDRDHVRTEKAPTQCKHDHHRGDRQRECHQNNSALNSATPR